MGERLRRTQKHDRHIERARLYMALISSTYNAPPYFVEFTLSLPHASCAN